MRRFHPSFGALAALIAAMSVFGTIGVAKHYIPLGSGTVAFFRAAIGSLTLAFPLLLRCRRGAPLSRRRLPLLFLSGAMIGANWILLFEAYRYTTVAIATVSYYMAPVLMIVAAALFFRERLSPLRVGCLLAAVFGLLLVSGLFEPNGGGHLFGVLLGLSAALLYAAIILQNKLLSDIPAYDRTLCQMLSAAVVLFPYVLIVEDIGAVLTLRWDALLLLIGLGILHTGIAYVLYFFAVAKLRTVTVAIFSYLDPVLSVLLSALVLGEAMTPLAAIGSVIVLGAAALGELFPGERG